jgi:selenophosphate synthase
MRDNHVFKHQEHRMQVTDTGSLRLTSFSHGGGCGCKIAPGVLADILKQSKGFPVPPQLLVGIETADDLLADLTAGLVRAQR